MGEEIKWNLKTLSVYYPSNKAIRETVVMLIAKKIHELMEKKIEVEIEGKKFHLELKLIKSFTNHIESLKEMLKS